MSANLHESKSFRPESLEAKRQVILYTLLTLAGPLVATRLCASGMQEYRQSVKSQPNSTDRRFKCPAAAGKGPLPLFDQVWGKAQLLAYRGLESEPCPTIDPGKEILDTDGHVKS